MCLLLGGRSACSSACAIANLLSELEAASGLVVTQPAHSQVPCLESLYPRLLTLAEHLLSLMEDFYKKFYHQTLPDVQKIAAETDDRNAALVIRLQALLDTALRISEEYFNLLSKGELSDSKANG